MPHNNTTTAAPANHASLACNGRASQPLLRVRLALTFPLASAAAGSTEAVAHGNPSAPIPAEAVAAPAVAATFALLPCRTAASSEVANASADGYRSAELFARHRRIIRSSSAGTKGFRCDGGTGSACKICAHTALTELPSNGATPVTI